MVTASRPAGGAWLLAPVDETAPQSFTPERLGDEHQMIAASVRTFLAQEVAPLDARLEAKDLEAMRGVLRKLAGLGIFAADVPPAYGGLGLSPMVGIVLAETISRGSLAATAAAHVTIGTLPIVYFGTDAQRRRYLPRLAAGEWVGAYALTEPTAGSDALSLRTTARRDADGAFRLSGAKQFITNGGLADVFILYARLDDKVTCFIVDRDTPGFTVGPEEHKMGLRGSSTTSLFLEDARVPADRVLGEPGRGHVVALNILNLGRLKLAAGCVGAAKHAMRDAVAYARERRQFGRPIASFGLITDKIARMAVRLFLAESAVYRAAGLLDAALSHVDLTVEDRGRQAAAALEEYAVECAINKVLASEMLDAVVDDAVQIFGGYGFIEDYPAARAYRDARINRLYEGTNEINRLLITGQLLRRDARGRLGLLERARASVGALEEAAARGDPGSAGDPGAVSAAEAVLERAKTSALACLARVVDRVGPDLHDQQELAAWLSDQIIEVFALESAWLRVRQHPGSGWAPLMADLVAQAARDTSQRVEQSAASLLSSVQDANMAERDLRALRVLLHVRATNVVAARRTIAHTVIEAGAYPLGLPAV